MKPVASSRGRGVYLINNVSVHRKDCSSVTVPSKLCWLPGKRHGGIELDTGLTLNFSHILVSSSKALSSLEGLPGPVLCNQKQSMSLFAVLILASLSLLGASLYSLRQFGKLCCFMLSLWLTVG